MSTTASIKIDDRVYVTGTLILVAIGLTIALVIWIARVISWKWNRYITSVAMERLPPPQPQNDGDDDGSGSDYYQPQPPPTIRRTNRGRKLN